MIEIANFISNLVLFGLAVFLLGIGVFCFLLLFYAFRDWRERC